MCNYQHARQRQQQQQHRRRMKSSEVGKKLNAMDGRNGRATHSHKRPSGIALYRYVEHGLLFTERANCFIKKEESEAKRRPKAGL